ncbi:MAG TPA: hypothetical protein VFI65_13025 [Streptosporangiaceae bacterium]|nr:hypothetical protein [Streptosporangiaceae bacterium]
MRTPAALTLLACCFLTVTACTTKAPKGPDADVTVPSVGKPPPPVSAQAALASEAFTPYAGLGAVSNGLAPGETYQALHTACMNDAGYGQYAADSPIAIRANRGLAIPQPSGPWGYVGVSVAQQYGFRIPDVGPGPGPEAFTSLPLAVQEAGNKCANIILDFNDREFSTSLAGIETMNNEISTDVIQDAAFKKATTAWSKCMAKNGYTASDPNAFAQAQEQRFEVVTPGSAPTPFPTQNQSQIAMAVTDAQCTVSSDLAGIYFAVQADYEQQFVTANQQALNVAVRQYKADYARELRKLPGLLRTASGKLTFSGPRKRVHPSPSRSAS